MKPLEKKCSKCGLTLPYSEFFRSSDKSDGFASSCKDCYRVKNGHKKRPTREARVCSHCKESFFPRLAHIRENKTGNFFCSFEHQNLYKQSNAQCGYYGYRKYILERDGNACVLCHRTDRPLHVHHIHTRGSGGTDEYLNLATLCFACHQTKAHGFKDAQRTKEILLAYTSRFTRPTYWDDVIKHSQRDRSRIKEYVKRANKKHKERIKASPRYKEYLARMKENKKKYLEYRRALRQATGTGEFLTESQMGFGPIPPVS